MKKIIYALLLTLSMQVIYAGGYRVSLQGQKSLAMGHAGVALINSAELAFFNPSGLVFLDNKLNISAGVSGVKATTKYQNLDTRQAFTTESPIATPFYLYGSYEVTDWLTAGISVYTPYGSSVEWPTGWAGSHLVNNIELAAIYVNPVVAFQICPKFSIGGGPIFVTGSVNFNRDRDLTTSNIDGRTGIEVSKDNVTNWGWVASATFKPFDELVIGASYRSHIDMNAENGEVSFTNFDSAPETTFNAMLPLPAELSVGLSIQASEKLLLAVEFNHTYWSEYESLTLEFSDEQLGTSVNPRNYENATTSRIGLEYTASEKFKLRGGYYFDESPVASGFFSPETPRNDAHGFTSGFSYEFNEKWALDFSFLYLHFNEVDESYDAAPQDGIPAFSGTYKSNVFVPGIGVSYKL